ncbi:hypothetical protein CEQ90_00465 [Lewinellaceae bacterium SD302]|nr:hypothetical protein CEQ90_00465 [Lewinellaceae bacterium SD302]
MNISLKFAVLTPLLLILVGSLSQCRLTESTSGKYEQYCGNCHLLPDPSSIPAAVWRESVLPEMAARLGFKYQGYQAVNGSMEEEFYTQQSNVYPEVPLIDSSDWWEIHDYVLSLAPEEIVVDTLRSSRNQRLEGFTATLIANKKIEAVTGILHAENKEGTLICDLSGRIFVRLDTLHEKARFPTPTVAAQVYEERLYLTEIGNMAPSQIPSGKLHLVEDSIPKVLAEKLHRPVYVLPADLDEDGNEEIIVCEFGYHTGALSLISKTAEGYKKGTLLPLPGSIKVELADMDHDGRLDIIALFSQGQEGIYIFYQQEDFGFKVAKPIELPPQHGSSWFELVDYDRDGHLDIVIANGDNADYSNFLKPYHGIRLYLNGGEDDFDEAWFYPIYGATRLEADDFDQDGDLDFAVLAFFPDFNHSPEEGLVYLRNEDESTYDFTTMTTPLAADGNWLTMEKGDFDEDGDLDLMLGNYPFLLRGKAGENRNNADFLILENLHF